MSEREGERDEEWNFTPGQVALTTLETIPIRMMMHIYFILLHLHVQIYVCMFAKMNNISIDPKSFFNLNAVLNTASTSNRIYTCKTRGCEI